MDSFFLMVLLLIVLAAFGVIAYIFKKKMHLWISNYLIGLGKAFFNNSHARPTDIMFLFVDHFELNGHQDRLNAWIYNYPDMARKHTDSDGRYPAHTFFYAMDLMHEHELEALRPIMDQGFGEIELHWHHSHDSHESAHNAISSAMTVFHHHGFMTSSQKFSPSCFGFIHGNWSLANARGVEYCGVDDEIQLLKDLGCYADFTFPALFSPAQPSQINQIYYCSSDYQHQTYTRGRQAEVGIPQTADEFMIFQGPLTINWKDWRHRWHPTIEDGDINRNETQGDAVRIDAWIKQAIHVKGRSEWLFVKVFCHGAQDYKSVTGPATDKMFHYLETTYNDGENYRLHYVTAREAYNIVKAAEAGKSGNPNQYRDYVIPPPKKVGH